MASHATPIQRTRSSNQRTIEERANYIVTTYRLSQRRTLTIYVRGNVSKTDDLAMQELAAAQASTPEFP